jgi:hypothetical protein
MLQCRALAAGRTIITGSASGRFSRPGPRPALDEMEILARALKILLLRKVRDVDDEGIALPARAGIAISLANVGGQMGTSVHDDVPLPPLSLTYVVEHRDSAGCLDDPVCALAPDARQPGGQTSHRRRALLRTVVAIYRYQVVTGRGFGEAQRGRRIVFAAGTAAVLDPAGLGRLQ